MDVQERVKSCQCPSPEFDSLRKDISKAVKIVEESLVLMKRIRSAVEAVSDSERTLRQTTKQRLQDNLAISANILRGVKNQFLTKERSVARTPQSPGASGSNEPILETEKTDPLQAHIKKLEAESVKRIHDSTVALHSIQSQFAQHAMEQGVKVTIITDHTNENAEQTSGALSELVQSRANDIKKLRRSLCCCSVLFLIFIVWYLLMIYLPSR